VPVEDEVERALASMRTGFLSGSTQIAAGVASLEEYLAEAPPDQRERVGATVAQIVATQERLIAQIGRLPRRSWDRFKAMVSIVKAQQVILDELGLLVKEYVLPRQLQELSDTPPVSAAPKSAPRRPPSHDDDAPTRKRTGSGYTGLAAMIVAALVLALIPRDINLQAVVAKLVEMFGGGGQSAPPGAPDATAGAELPPAAVPDEQFVPVVFTHKDQATVTRALADLKRQYPKLMIGREGEVRPVDLGKKGIWHRLVLLPASPRPQATRLCDQLMMEGYDRCWVTAY